MAVSFIANSRLGRDPAYGLGYDRDTVTTWCAWQWAVLITGLEGWPMPACFNAADIVH